MSYAWMIDKDHLADDGERGAVGTIGPLRPEPARRLLDLLSPTLTPKGYYADCELYTFEMYDGDGELYYTGRLVTDEGKSEDACYSPLGDFGMPGAGCTDIRYPGHPEMDCG